jgi:hypothetical protein
VQQCGVCYHLGGSTGRVGHYLDSQPVVPWKYHLVATHGLLSGMHDYIETLPMEPGRGSVLVGFYLRAYRFMSSMF